LVPLTGQSQTVTAPLFSVPEAWGAPGTPPSALSL
jgi:hypothetical protein